MFRLLAGQAVLRMTENLVVVAGNLLFDGGGRTLTTGNFGFRVMNSANLCLYNVNLIDGLVRSFAMTFDCPGRRREQHYFSSSVGNAKDLHATRGLLAFSVC